MLIFDLLVFNIVSGDKETISFELKRFENNNKDEIIKTLYLKINSFKEKLNIMNEKYNKIMTFIEPMIKEKEEINNRTLKLFKN